MRQSKNPFILMLVSLLIAALVSTNADVGVDRAQPGLRQRFVKQSVEDELSLWRAYDEKSDRLLPEHYRKGKGKRMNRYHHGRTKSESSKSKSERRSKPYEHHMHNSKTKSKTKHHIHETKSKSKSSKGSKSKGKGGSPKKGTPKEPDCYSHSWKDTGVKGIKKKCKQKSPKGEMMHKIRKRRGSGKEQKHYSPTSSPTYSDESSFDPDMTDSGSSTDPRDTTDSGNTTVPGDTTGSGSTADPGNTTDSGNNTDPGNSTDSDNPKGPEETTNPGGTSDTEGEIDPENMDPGNSTEPVPAPPPENGDKTNSSGTDSVEMPTGPPTADLAPADAPSVAPTEKEGNSSEVLPKDPRQKDEQRLWIHAEPLIVETLGEVDLSTVESSFFEAVKLVFTPFITLRLGDKFDKYEVTITHLQDETVVIPGAASGSPDKYKNRFEFIVMFEVVGEDMEMMNTFKKEAASEIVASFFKGTSEVILLNTLNKNGLSIESIDIVEDKDQESEPDPATAEEDLEANNPGSQDGDSKTTIYASVGSAVAVVLLALIAVVWRKRRRQQRYIDAFESELESVYSEGSRESQIKPAAIQRRKNGRGNPNGSLGSGGSVSSYSLSLGPVKEEKPEPEEERGEIDDSEDVVVEEGPYDVALNQLKGDRQIVASSTLTCLDDSQTVDGLANQYPEFEMYASDVPTSSTTPGTVGRGLEVIWNPARTYGPQLQGPSESASLYSYSSSSVPTSPIGMYNSSFPSTPVGRYSIQEPSSPVWSIPGLSGMSEYDEDDEEYQRQRKRWHDEANDLTLIELSDNESHRRSSSPESQESELD